MLRSLVVVLVLGFAVCVRADEPKVSREDTQVRSMRARVTAVDQKTRQVTLENASGEKSTFRADEAVKNLPQVKVGDEVLAELVQSLAVEVREATEQEKAAPDSVVVLAATAEPGQKPAGLFTRQMRALFTIESIDKAKGGGTIKDSQGKSHWVTPRDPAVLDKVKVGDLVVATLNETLRIAVVPPEKKK